MKVKSLMQGPWPLGVDSKSPNEYLSPDSLALARNVKFDGAGRVMPLADRSNEGSGDPIVWARYSHQLRKIVAATVNTLGYLSKDKEYSSAWPLGGVVDWEAGQEFLLAANGTLYALPLKDSSVRYIGLTGNACALVGSISVGAMIGSNLVEYSSGFEDGSGSSPYYNNEPEVYRYRLTSGKVTALAGVGYSLFIGTDLGLLHVQGLGTEQETERYLTRRPVPKTGVVALPGVEIGNSSLQASTNVAVWFDTDGLGFAAESGEVSRPVKDRFYLPSIPERVLITASNGVIIVSEIR